MVKATAATVRNKKTAPTLKKGRHKLAADCLKGRATPPSNSIWAKKVVNVALKKGVVVLDIDGKYHRVSLKQKLSLRSRCTKARGATQRERYEHYKAARTLGEAFTLGALPDDLPYDLKHGLLKFVPALQSTEAEAIPQSQWPPGIRASELHPPFWLPMNWADGVKTTCKCRLPVYIAPNMKTYYHQEVVEAIVQAPQGHRQVDRMVAWAKKQLSEGRDWHGEPVEFDQDAKLFACLTKPERMCLPKSNEFHFCVVSARRATELGGITGIVNVQARLVAAGVRPRWYVDADSLEDYRSLGLDAVLGGKLTPSRNKALREAAQLKKACVQVSDDISEWEFYKTNLDAAALRKKGAVTMLKAANKNKSACKLVVSPLAAARFMLAQMRAADGHPRLGGVLPTANGALALLAQMTSVNRFILGDFFVHDGSTCRFDETITLKEDYDFTCSHIKRHGCVLRCNRLVLKVRHETNAGGAVTERDASGDRERRNIKILMDKWPGVFKLHSTRGDTQVKMNWNSRKF